MKAVCKNNPDHKRFLVTAHVCQDWEIDEKGNFIETVDECSQVIHYPDSNDEWRCAECGGEVGIIDE